ncbi:hypothetical protein [Demequina sp.]|uniref:hypothetical protein n=1 Tax=Demequina sp. TaxID=2050685 RepID=UPI0025BB2CB9|nr:hypothetical protein [Demequina sp.]
MENDETSELSPADALASTRAGREAIARRIRVPWQWDAGEAVSIGIFMALIAYTSPPWTTMVISGWAIVFLGMVEARRRRTGIVAGGNTRRTFDPLHLVVLVVTLGVFTLGMIAGARWWDGIPVVTAVIAAGVILGGYRWINRRAVARVLAGS